MGMSLSRWFSATPISKKLRGMIMLTCAVALLLASAAFVGYELWRYRSVLEQQLQSIGDVIGITSTAALDFDDAAAGQEILAALAAEPRVVSASLLRSDGSSLATYQQAGRENMLSGSSNGSRHMQVTVTRPITLNGTSLGSIELQGELTDVWVQITRYLYIVGSVLGLTLGVAFLLSLLLERIVSVPLSHLTQTAAEVSEHGDYSRRAVPKTSDEIGTLVARFNEMLDQIQQRDHALKEANLSLEERVRVRTMALQEAKTIAESASRAKSDFMANMSHELRTPMVGVLGFAELLLTMEQPPEQKEFTEGIISSGDSLLRLVDDLLDFSRIEADELNLKAAPFDLQELIESVTQVFFPRTREGKIALGWDIDRSLPKRILSDPMRLRQILINLVGNAVKFTVEGSVAVRVLRGAGDEPRLRFIIQDTGVGISAEAIPTLFDPFTQADTSSTRQFGGTGLGLTISKRIVERMGGVIGVKSVQGAGSTFWFELPFEPVEDGPSAELEAEPREKINSSGHSVLLVEDNQLNRRFVTHLLETLGYEVTAAPDGYDALDLFRTRRFDLVLMDCQMPGIDGFETTRRLRQQETGTIRVPVVAVTAHAMSGDREKCLTAGMDDYLAKPFRVQELEAVLKRWMPG